MQKSIGWPAGILISWDNFESGNHLCPTRLFCPARFINAQNRTGFTEKDLTESGWPGPDERQRLPAVA